MANDVGTFAASAAFVILTACVDAGGDTANTTDETSATPAEGTSSESSIGSETDEPETKSIELIISGGLDSGGGFFRYRWTDGVAEGPTPLVEPSALAWSYALQLPERRVVVQSDTQIWLGSLDGAPADLIPLDGPPVDDGPLTRARAVPGQDAVVFTSELSGTAYRVDFPDGVAMDPVVIADDATTLAYPLNGINGAVDPLGRYLLFDRDAGKVNVALAPLDPEHTGDTISLTDFAAPHSARYHGFMPDGSGLFWVTFEETGEHWDPARELYFAALDGDTIGPAMIVEEPGASASFISRCVPHPLGLGVVVFAAHDSIATAHDLSYYAIIDGIVQPPVILMADVLDIDTPTWSPDGNWLTFTTFAENSGERFLVEIANGEALPTTSLTTFDLDSSNEGTALFSADSQWLYFEHDYAGVRDLERVQLTQGGWDNRQVIVPDTPETSRPHLADLSSNGESLLYLADDQGVSAVLAIDVSGRVPGAPVTMSRPPVRPGAWAWEAEFSPDDEFIVYFEPVDVFEDDRLMLVDVDAPGEAIEVIADAWHWQFVTAD